jgi:hypothetical protein
VRTAAGQFDLDQPSDLVKLLVVMARRKLAFQVRKERSQRRDNRRLEPGCVYRIDRTDVMSDVPVDGALDEQLAYCRSHWIRLCAREGTFKLTADGLRQIEPEDITRPESGIHFRDSWFPVEQYNSGERFRWIGNDAEVLAQAPPGSWMRAAQRSRNLAWQGVPGSG